MGLSSDVRLPKNRKPEFPNRCVVCGQEHPDSTVPVSTRAIGWWTWMFWLPGRKFSVQVPACSGCGRRLWRQHLFRWLITIVLILCVVFAIAPFFADFPRAYRKWLILGAVIVVLLPWFLWQVFFPPPLDLTAFSDSIDYEFRDRAYAEEFASLNQAKVDGIDQEKGETDD